MEIGTTRWCLDKQVPCFLRNSSVLDWENVRKFPYRVVSWNLRTNYPKLVHSRVVSARKHRMCRLLWIVYSASVEESSLPSEDHASSEEEDSEYSTEKLLAQPLSSVELKSLLADSERQKLIRKLSEANQQNRFLKRQLHVEEDALVNFKSKLAVMELEVQHTAVTCNYSKSARGLAFLVPYFLNEKPPDAVRALVLLAEEIARSGIPEGSRKISGRFIQSHLHSRLEAVHEKMKEQIKDVGAAQSKEVSLFWCGMAESVQVMGTFDGWSQGEHLSPEYTGSFTKFSATLMLRPGRYEIKFLVDEEWQLSPEFPTVGEGLMTNNLLIVE